MIHRRGFLRTLAGATVVTPLVPMVATPVKNGFNYDRSQQFREFKVSAFNIEVFQAMKLADDVYQAARLLKLESMLSS